MASGCSAARRRRGTDGRSRGPGRRWEEAEGHARSVLPAWAAVLKPPRFSSTKARTRADSAHGLRAYPRGHRLPLKHGWGQTVQQKHKPHGPAPAECVQIPRPGPRAPRPPCVPRSDLQRG